MVRAAHKAKLRLLSVPLTYWIFTTHPEDKRYLIKLIKEEGLTEKAAILQASKNYPRGLGK